jgi:hypothetical protein
MKNDPRISVVGVLAIPLSIVGCGSGAAAPHCAQVEPCGGDVVGSWSFAGACVNNAAASVTLAAICPGASISVSSLAVSGSITFNSDLSYSGPSVSVSETATESVPLSCTGQASCAALGTSSNGMTATCSGTTVCTCRVSSSASGTAAGALGSSGTYSISDTTLALQSSSSTSTMGSYCVQGTELHLVSVDATMNMGPMGMATITSDVVALKQ